MNIWVRAMLVGFGAGLFAVGPAVGQQMTTETRDPNQKQDPSFGAADEANVLARYVGGNASELSGLMVGADSLKQRPFAVDIPRAYHGFGRVILFSNNPIYRWQNHGEFNMIFNSLLNWNDIVGRPE